jgi:hypothetical protein
MVVLKRNTGIIYLHFSLPSGRYTGAASFGAIPASLCTPLAMFHSHLSMFLTFFRTGIAYFCAFVQKVLCMF